MKRTATTLALLAGFGGGCMSTDGPGAKRAAPQPHPQYGTVTRPATAPGYQGPAGEPIGLTPTSARGAAPGAVHNAGYSRTATDALGVRPAGFKKGGDCATCAHVPGVYGQAGGPANYGPGVGPSSYGGPVDPASFGGPVDPASFGGPTHGGRPQPGILPVPGMGPPGAVAAVGAMVPGMRPPAINMRTSINFTGPAGMRITWQLPSGGFNDPASGLVAPQAYNFLQGQVYRLRLTQILPDFPGRSFYPTLEIAPATPKTITFLSHSSVPITFTQQDFDQVVTGNMVVKVIYLPDPQFQDFAVVGGAAEEIVSTRLEPGADPVAEAQRKGTILAIIRMGNIDLENRGSPAMNAVPRPAVPPGMVIPLPGPGAPGQPKPMAPGAGPGAPMPMPVPPGVSAVPPGPLPLPSRPMAPTAPPLARPTATATPAPPVATPLLPPGSGARPGQLPGGLK